MAVNFDDQSTGRSYDNYPKDPEAREQIAIVKDKVEKLVNTTVSRQVVTNLENKFKQNELDNVNYRNQVGETVRTIEEKVDGLDGGNTEKIANLEAVVNNKANKDIVDSLLNQIEGSVKQINGVAPDENGNVAIDLNTQNLVGKLEFTEKTDQLALQMMEKVNVAELENVLGRTDELTTIIAEKANQSEIDAAKGGFETLKQKLDNMVISGGGNGGGISEGTATGDQVQIIGEPAPGNVPNLTVKTKTKTSMVVAWDASLSGNIYSYKIYKDNVLIATVPYKTRQIELNGLSAYTEYTIKVTSVNDNDVESTGTTSALLTEGYVLKMSGYSGTIVKTPPLFVTKMILIFKITKKKENDTTFLYDGRNAAPLSGTTFKSDGLEGWSDYFTTIIINGKTLTTAMKTTQSNIKIGELTTLEATRTSGGSTASFTLFGNNIDYNGSQPSTGELYSAKFYNGSTLLADYDFRKGTFTDQSGNNNALMISKGEFI